MVAYAESRGRRPYGVCNMRTVEGVDPTVLVMRNNKCTPPKQLQMLHELSIYNKIEVISKIYII